MHYFSFIKCTWRIQYTNSLRSRTVLSCIETGTLLFKAVCKSARFTHIYRWLCLFCLSCSIVHTSVYEREREKEKQNITVQSSSRSKCVLSSHQIISARESGVDFVSHRGDYVSRTAFWFSWAIELWKLTCIHMFTPGLCLFQGNIWQGADVKVIL